MSKIKNLAKMFWLGIVDALKFVCAILLVMGGMAVVLSVASVLGCGAVMIIEHFGWGALVFYAIDLTIFGFAVSELMDLDYKGNFIQKNLKRFGLLLLALCLILICNLILWGIGSILLILFGVKWSLGATMGIGLLAIIAIITMVLVCVYIRDNGWAKFFGLLMRFCGILLVAFIIAVLVNLLL